MDHMENVTLDQDPPPSIPIHVDNDMKHTWRVYVGGMLGVRHGMRPDHVRDALEARAKLMREGAIDAN